MMTDLQEKLEAAGKRVHLLLYGGERENDPHYTEWRGDLEAAIGEWIELACADEREHVLSGQEPPRLFMVLGLKDFPVNPNDFYSDYTEADNPYLFYSRELAQKFIDRAQDLRDPVMGEYDEINYFRIVEIVK